VTVSGGGTAPGSYVTGFTGSGSQICLSGYAPSTSSGWSRCVTLSNATASGGGSIPADYIKNFIGSGSKICLSTTYYSKCVTLSNATASGGGTAPVVNYVTGFTGSGSKICLSTTRYDNPWSTCVTLSGGTTTYTCPYGSSYTCDSSHNCTRTGSCDVSTSNCPSGYSWNGSTCIANATCPSGGNLDGENDVCYISQTYYCDSGYTYDSAIGACVASASCTSGGVLNTSLDVCQLTATPGCPSGYIWDSSPGVCELTPQCGSGSSYNASRDRCEIDPTQSCISGTSYNPSTGYCEVSATCLNSGSLNVSTNKCEVVVGHSCPIGHTYNSSTGKCEATPTCPTGGSYDTSSDLCSVANTWVCPSGMTLSGTTCYMDSNCPTGGSLNVSTDKCEVEPVISCPSGYTFDSSLGICRSSPVCDAGSYDATIDKCKVSVSTLCPAGYNFNPATNKCEMNPPCLSGSQYSVTADKCVRDATHDCVVGTAYSPTSRKCEAIPICTHGVYDPEHHGCYVGDNVCPLGNYSCINNGNGQNQCSPNQCIDISVPTNEIITKVDDTMLQDDGPKDAQGNCLGEIYIFTGRGVRCRGSGVDTSFVNCCNQGNTVVKDSIGSAKDLYIGMATVKNVYHLGEVVYYGSQFLANPVTYTMPTQVAQEVGTALTVVQNTGSIEAGLQSYATTTFLNPTTLAISVAMYLVEEMLFSGGCDQEDLETSIMSSSGRCHYVGSYCETEWPLVGCVQRAKGYCCFNSKLARIIHEQGRPQLENFKNNLWGTPEGPYCRGFTVAEFQMLDFSKIDLSEYFGEIQTKAQSEIVGTAQKKIQDFYNKTQ